MSIPTTLEERSENSCELCGSKETLKTYLVPPKSKEIDENCVVVCHMCHEQLVGTKELEANYWRCLNDSMWSQVPAVQVVVNRLLTKLEVNTDWAADLKAMMYMDEETLEWTQSVLDSQVIHKDSNGNILKHGDNVVLIKDLVVKGGNFTAKRGTTVRRISLVHDNANQIEGRVNDQQIVILTQYVKKS